LGELLSSLKIQSKRNTRGRTSSTSNGLAVVGLAHSSEETE